MDEPVEVCRNNKYTETLTQNRALQKNCRETVARQGEGTRCMRIAVLFLDTTCRAIMTPHPGGEGGLKSLASEASGKNLPRKASQVLKSPVGGGGRWRGAKIETPAPKGVLESHLIFGGGFSNKCSDSHALCVASI